MTHTHANQIDLSQADDHVRTIFTKLDDMKVSSILILDVSQIASFCEVMLIGTGRSTRHIRAVAEDLALDLKKAGDPALGVDSKADTNWVVVDLDTVVVHLMTEEARNHYALEQLWSIEAPNQTISAVEAE